MYQAYLNFQISFFISTSSGYKIHFTFSNGTWFMWMIHEMTFANSIGSGFILPVIICVHVNAPVSREAVVALGYPNVLPYLPFEHLGSSTGATAITCLTSWFLQSLLILDTVISQGIGSKLTTPGDAVMEMPAINCVSNLTLLFPNNNASSICCCKKT